MLDYIVVGSGLAGISFTEFALQKGKSVIMIDNELRSSSQVAGGMYNPVILKRFTEVWKIREQLDISIPFFLDLEKKLNVTLNHSLPLYRRMLSVEEQNNWFQASDKLSLSPYLSSTLVKNTNKGIIASYDFGQVNETGYVDTGLLIKHYREYLRNLNMYLCETFDYDQFSYSEEGVRYKDIKAKHIIFAEGFGMLQNPFFKNLPLDGSKGEVLVVKIPNLNIPFILKGNVFLIPLGDDMYKVGATYDWEDKTDDITEKAKDELLSKLRELINLDFEVVEHTAGVRPTVKDRRPLVGTYKESDRIHLLNGLGTRGVLLGPFLSMSLLNNIEEGIPLDNNISIDRYYKKGL